MPSASGLALLPYPMVKPEVLGARMAALIRSNQTRIAREFPSVATRYASLEMATRSVAKVTRSVTSSNGMFAAYAVTFDGVVVGAATLMQKTLTGRGWKFGRTLVKGPLLAGWLGSYELRPDGATLPLMPGILCLLAQEIRQTDMPGTPWTLARPDHGHTVVCLMERGNGFGGFYAPLPPGNYGRVDGVDEPRALYIPNGTKTK
ncbi:MAG TPA: hypothetical protein VM581_02605 [Magnetospirillaceae bacterium]|nr:hypothetical protein [Magnetospirillaceae bacterium]